MRKQRKLMENIENRWKSNEIDEKSLKIDEKSLKISEKAMKIDEKITQIDEKAPGRLPRPAPELKIDAF